ncbi:MAG: ribonuclease P protein component [Clostridia bacterium]|nr:ribonuclease P protein component [Clostridia bacterium]
MRLFTLKKNREFKKVFNAGRSVADRYLVMYILRKEDAPGVKFGFSVSKKIGKAVVRNAVRRKLKEICRLNQDKFLPGVEIIIIARAPVVEVDFATLKRSIFGLAKRAKLFKKES